MVADVNLLQDMEEIVVVDVDQVVDQAALLIQDLVEITVVYGSFFFSFSVAAVVITLAVTTAVDATIAAANQTNFKDGFFRPFFHRRI